MLINMFDTAIDSDNLGDQFIMDAVWQEVRGLFPEADFISTPTHRRASLTELREGRKADLSIVGGTNILKSHMLVRGNWKITPLDYLNWRNVVLMGVGWQQYGRAGADVATRLFFNKVLSKTLLHSVRDMHTYELLRPHVPNIVYTACPTMWMLDRAHCQTVPVRKARDAVFAVTYYRPAPELDLKIFEMLRQQYRTVYFWPQQEEDLPYMQEIGATGYVPIAPDVAAYDRLLDMEDVDFIGARLHGGIRALQRRRRALIIPVDNRATELSVSTGLPVASRTEPDAIDHWINNPRPLSLTLPLEGIVAWMGQFRQDAALVSQPLATAAS
ncbi:polysaccharide pyruvyl transferase family protein [Niveispirillum sp. KHB5.9]|uniref:polysaccharide pyruvyl transferase family protein n=1 Tax=Niveispirillum sp. KHB5.9 TaxID=3400269 RepID=UPI003A87F561